MEEWTSSIISESEPYSISTAAPIELSDSPWMTSQSFIWEFDLNPANTNYPVGLLDKSHLSGDREYRVVLWGYSYQGSFIYTPDRIQIALGDSNGDWSMLWYPQVVVEPNVWTRLTIDWNGQEVSLFKDGSLVASTPYSGSLKDTSTKLIIGGVRSGSNAITRPYSGSLKVSIH